MLKIKDNVDLKELEKYGFKKQYMNGPSYTKSLCQGITVGFILIREEHSINGMPIGDARELQFIHIDSQIYSLEFDRMLSILYDLIKDGLIEKVEKC